MIIAVLRCEFLIFFFTVMSVVYAIFLTDEIGRVNAEFALDQITAVITLKIIFAVVNIETE